MDAGRSRPGRESGARQAGVAALVVLGLALALAPGTARAAPPTPFGHPCSPENGVLFCPTEDLGDRVASFDGAPLDVDVTLPAGTGAGEALPTIVMMHGWGGSKGDFQASSPEGEGASNATTFHWNNNYFARQGYAVVNYTARGFGRSCGQEAGSNATPECLSTRSYIHLADHRWEARDTQHLLGLLVDQGITEPDRIGVTGISYGGGQSINLAYLRDRIRNADGSFSSWRSPEGTPMEIAAAFPRWPWSDLISTLLPNGRFQDAGVSSPTESLEPVGIPLLSYVNGLFVVGGTAGTYCGTPPRTPPCTDPTADIADAFATLLAGEPYGPQAEAYLREYHEFHSGYGLAEHSDGAAPMLLQSGWTDDLFAPEQSLRVYNHLRAQDPEAPVALQLGDLGHARASNKEISDRAFNEQGAAFFDLHLRGGDGDGSPPPGSVTAYTQTCPRQVPTDGPFTARSYERLANGSLTASADPPQTVQSSGGDPATGLAIDPVAGGGDACRELADSDAPGTATVRGEVSRGFTLLGRPTVRATVEAAGDFGQLNPRLWDVGPDGRQTLVTRGAFRLEDDHEGRVGFQMNGNGYCFADGHVPKLELVGRDAPYLRPSNSVFSVDVSDVSIELPTAEPDPVPQLEVNATPRRVRGDERRRFRFTVTSREPQCATSDRDRPERGVPVANAEIELAGRSTETNQQGEASLTLRLSGAGARLAKATKPGYEAGEARIRVVRAPGGDNRDRDRAPEDDAGGGAAGGGAGGGETATVSAVGRDRGPGALPLTGLELAAILAAGLLGVLLGLALRRAAKARST
jgi:predicted acyl esterase